MFSCEYRKDLNHNYLIITETTEMDSTYEKEMFLRNEIKRLLSCHVRIMNAETKYYYEISSKQSFESAFFIREISFLDLKNLFCEMKMMINELQKYLLDQTKIILNPKYIYIELETDQLFFLYHPYSTKEMEENMGELVDYLLEKVNHKDKQAIDFVYWLYDYTKKEEISLSKIIDYLSRNETVVKEEINTQVLETPETINEEKAPEVKHVSRLKPKTILSIYLRNIGLPILFEILFTKVLFEFFTLTPKELLLLFGGYAVLVAIGIIFVYKKLQDKASISDGPVLGNELEAVSKLEEIQKPEEGDYYGVTTFFGTNQVEHQKLLIGKVKGKEIQIPLENMPFVIGKIKESVNFAINDSSISRMHVKFFQKEDLNIVFMVDLNSTNGTYKNGVQLEANEEVEVVPEDEIQIGKLKFTYH